MPVQKKATKDIDPRGKKIVKGVDSKGEAAEVDVNSLGERVKRVEAERKGQRYMPPATHFKCNQCKEIDLLENRVEVKVEINTGSGNPHSKFGLHTYGTFMQICKRCATNIEKKYETKSGAK